MYMYSGFKSRIPYCMNCFETFFILNAVRQVYPVGSIHLTFSNKLVKLLKGFYVGIDLIGDPDRAFLIFLNDISADYNIQQRNGNDHKETKRYFSEARITVITHLKKQSNKIFKDPS